MSFRVNIFLIMIAITFLSSCAGGGRGPGYLFQILFIVIPIVLIGHYLHKKIETSNESLYVIEGQLKRLSSKLEAVEEKIENKTENKKKK